MTNHTQQAKWLMKDSTTSLKNGGPTTSAIQAQFAQVHATLALAEQQRVANLISYFTQIDDTSTALPVLHEIREALGIGDQNA